MSSDTLARICVHCKKDKKGCDLKRPCQRCKDRGRSADECVEVPLPPPPSDPKPTKKRAAAAARGSAKKRTKKQVQESEDDVAESEDKEAEEDGTEEEAEESGKEVDLGDDQPLDQLIWREGDPGVAYDAWVEVDEEYEEDEEGDQETSAAGEGTAEAQPPTTGNELPYYATPTYSALANRGIKIPVKTRQSVANLPDDDEE